LIFLLITCLGGKQEEPPFRMEMGGSDPQSKYSTGQLLEMCHRTALIDRPMGYFSNGSNGNQLARSGDCKQPAVLQGDEPIRTV